VYKIILLPAVLCEFQNWHLTLREFEKRGAEEDILGYEKRGNKRREGYIMRRFMICTPLGIVLE
jgi:hypothetical protein